MQGLRVLDPACGSGNFLYVTMGLLKDVEYEAVRELEALTGHPELRMEEIGPQNFLGLEVKPWAREVSELTLWIAYHQFWKRHHAVQPPEPVLADTGTLEQRDAVLAWDATRRVPAKDRPDITPRVPHPLTGELVPDPTATVPYIEHVGARQAPWPEADFIVGNPPYLGQGRQREAFGDGYVDALREVYPDVPDSADYVMYWWHRAAEAVASGRCLRAGLITTNSLTQAQNRAVVAQAASRDVRVQWAIADHPWVEETGGAAVRVAMTVLALRPARAILLQVNREGAVTATHVVPRLNDDLSAHADVPRASAIPLMANAGISSPGMKLEGAGFILAPHEAEHLLRLDARNAEVVRPYRNGKDLTSRARGVWVIDFGTRTLEAASAYPAVLSLVRERVKPIRDRKTDRTKTFWWQHGRPREGLREALAGLPRYIATVETTKHRTFQFLPTEIVPDNMLTVIASDDAYVLGVLSSAVHVAWALAAGGRLGVGNDPRYNKGVCLEPFPFPEASPTARAQIAALAERLDAHRVHVLEVNPSLTLTGLYNVLDAVRRGTSLTPKEREVHRLAACGVLSELHDALDAAVAAAYGWSWPEPPALILERLVALHARRLEEEAVGTVRWLRPEYQQARFAPRGETVAPVLDLPAAATSVAPVASAPVPWPADAIGQITALRSMAAVTPLSIEDAVRRLVGARKEIVHRHLETLAMLGEVQDLGGGRYAVAAPSF